MSTATETKFETTIEDAGPCRKRLTITAPADLIAEKIRDSYGALATSTALPGFRKGRAPMSLIERRFGSHVRMETRNQLLAEGYSAALEAHALKPVTEPEPVGDVESLELVDGKPLVYSVEVEVVPEFDLPDLEGLEVMKPIVAVDGEILDQELERQKTAIGEVVEVSEGFSEGDKIIGPGSVTKEGDEEPFFTHDAIDVIVPGSDEGGSGHVLGLMIEGLAGMIAGRKVGDELTIPTVGPESHELEHIRGRKLTISMKIEAGQRIVPASVEDVVARYGLESEQVLREQLVHALEQRLQVEQQAAMREQVYRLLGDSATFELPKKLTENQTTRLLERQRLEMLYRGGLSADEVERRLAEMRSEAGDVSQRRLKLQFLLHRLAEHFGVTVSEQEINGRIAQIAQTRNARPDKLRAELMRTGAMGQLVVQIRDHKACDRVIDQAKIEELPIEEYRDRMQSRYGAPADGDAAASGATKKKAGTGKKKTTTKKKAD